MEGAEMRTELEAAEVVMIPSVLTEMIHSNDMQSDMILV